MEKLHTIEIMLLLAILSLLVGKDKTEKIYEDAKKVVGLTGDE